VSALRQIRAVTAVALETIPQRLGTSLVVVIGIATTVAVLIAALAVATGFTGAATKSASPDRVIVLGGVNQGSSSISRANVAAVVDAPGVAHTASGSPIASAETFFSVAFTDSHTGRDAYIPVLGVGLQALALRPETKVIAGRLFVPGKREVIVGSAIEERIGGLSIGSIITLPDGDWKVVGIFASGGGALESQLMTDASSLMSAVGFTSFNSVTVRLVSSADFARFSAALAADPTLSVKPQRENEYYAAISRPIYRLLKSTAYGLGCIMAFGAIFGALNTTFSAVRARRTEIATLRAIGFGAPSVVVSVIIESLILGLAGALLGALCARLLLGGVRISTMVASGSPLHVTFGLEVGPGIVLIGVLFALVIALAGGLFAATQAARISIAVGMRPT
jgi:putative ABC transport system permease protein